MTETGAVGAGGPMPPKPISKTQTHVTGLAEILHGGLPTGRTTLVNGGPGSGKTAFGLEFIYRAALDGEPGIFISFEEDADSIRRNGLSLGWDLPALEEEGMLRILDGQLDPAVIAASLSSRAEADRAAVGQGLLCGRRRPDLRVHGVHG